MRGWLPTDRDEERIETWFTDLGVELDELPTDRDEERIETFGLKPEKYKVDKELPTDRDEERIETPREASVYRLYEGLVRPEQVEHPGSLARLLNLDQIDSEVIADSGLACFKFLH